MKDGLTLDAIGNKQWYKDGELHREEGPAFEYVYGDKLWYKDGELHREDGPAIEYNDDEDKDWYWHGKFIMETRVVQTPEQLQEFYAKTL